MRLSVALGTLEIESLSNALVAIKMNQTTNYLQIQLIMPAFHQHGTFPNSEINQCQQIS